MRNNSKTTAVVLATSFFLAACGGGGDEDDSAGGTPPPTGGALNAGAGAPTGAAGACNASTSGVNWDALMTEACPKLSDYNLFTNASDPTTGPTRGGVPYELSTALFSDYTSKYRFIYVPEGEQASFRASEVLDFPVGTVITKTFALPKNTALRDGEELVIETRLLIHRTDGWFALPYYWDSESDASLAIAGKRVADLSTINNQGQEITFNYLVPKQSDCSSCHAIVPGDAGDQIFLPIGPKARYLNTNHTYADDIVYNQLQYMAEGGILSGLPSDFQGIEQAPVFNDGVEISSLSTKELDDAARAYLDINCAHCHRDGMTLPDGYAGVAGSSGLQLEYGRVYVDDPVKFGVCKKAPAAGKEGYPFDVIPGSPGDSYLIFRMTTLNSLHKMPELARNTAHLEGIELIRSWIDQLPSASCSTP